MKKELEIEQKVILASDLTTPLEILQELYKEHDWRIDWALAANPNTPIEILEEFYNSGDIYLLKRMASNLGASPKILTKLSVDTRFEVYEALLRNINAPISALLNVVKNGDKYSKERAQKMINIKLSELYKLWEEE